MVPDDVASSTGQAMRVRWRPMTWRVLPARLSESNGI
jgi:hypothetical protein